MPEQISRTLFKAKALEYFRQVETTGEPLIITDHGRPTLELRPLKTLTDQEKTQQILEQLRGSVVYYKDPFEPVGLEDWEALKE